MKENFYVYIMSSKTRGTLYVGVTSDLPTRIHAHKAGTVEGFTRKYGIKRLVYYEVHNNAESAISREKQIKKWNRTWKLKIVEEHNPEWVDLYEELI